MMNFSPG